MMYYSVFYVLIMHWCKVVPFKHNAFQFQWLFPCYSFKRMQKVIFLTLSPINLYLWKKRRPSVGFFSFEGFLKLFFKFIFILLHSPITALNQASCNIFFTIIFTIFFLHGYHTPSLLFLISVQFQGLFFPLGLWKW